MQFLEQEIYEITETTWQALLGLNIQANNSATTIGGSSEEYLTGMVEISGAWNGVVALHGSGQLAHFAASVIFGNGHFEMTGQDRKDAMYELTNVIAGNIKALLPGPSRVSLPIIMQTSPETLRIPHAERVSELIFNCRSQPLFVSLWKR
jgi:chemotaxis protein CheX